MLDIEIQKKIVGQALTKMFAVVGAKYVPGKRYPRGWYLNRSWTDKQETKFKIWLVAFLRKKLQWPKRMAEKEASWFLFDYGWKTTDSRSD
jgi:hypothetical protein